MRVLGIDPGLRVTGYACITGDAASPAAVEHAADIVEAGVFRLVRGGGKVPPIASRLVELEQDLAELVDRTAPDAACVEGLFAHYRHPSTAVAMGHARGVILLVLARAGVPVREIKPAEVKRSATGNGAATKRQVQLSVAARLGLAAVPEPHDVADALAIALAGLRREHTDVLAAAETPARKAPNTSP